MRWHSSFCKLSYLVVMLLALSYRHLTSPLLTWDGWCDWKSRYQSVCGLPVYHDIQAAISSLLEQGVKKGEASILLHFYSEHDGWSHTVEVAQESFHCALLNNAAGVSSTHSMCCFGSKYDSSSPVMLTAASTVVERCCFTTEVI